jgi:hypothetical protein
MSLKVHGSRDCLAARGVVDILKTLASTSRIFGGRTMAASRNGVEKCGPVGLLASSADRDWSGMPTELRSHSNGVIAWKGTQPDTEIGIDVRGSGAVVRRQGDGFFDWTIGGRGTVWFSPAGRKNSLAEFSDHAPEICISTFRQATSRQSASIQACHPSISSSVRKYEEYRVGKSQRLTELRSHAHIVPWVKAPINR